jgi:hypothetical protein
MFDMRLKRSNGTCVVDIWMLLLFDRCYHHLVTTIEFQERLQELFEVPVSKL